MTVMASKGASQSSGTLPIETLKCGAGNNFPKWKLSIQKLLFEKYENIAEVTRTNAPHVPPEIQEEDYVPAARAGVRAMTHSSKNREFSREKSNTKR